MSKIKKMMIGLGGSETMRLSERDNLPQVYKKLEYLAFPIYLCTL